MNAATATVSSLDGFHETAFAQRADELVRAVFDAVNSHESARLDPLLDRGFLSYDVRGIRSRTGLKHYYGRLRRSFSDLRVEVHENIGVLVEGDLIALRTIITGTHAGDYAGIGATGAAVQTSASHMFRVREDRLVEHWQVVDTYRILVAIGAIPGVASCFQQLLGVGSRRTGSSKSASEPTSAGADDPSRVRNPEPSRDDSSTEQSTPDALRTLTRCQRPTCRTPVGRQTGVPCSATPGDRPRRDARRPCCPDPRRRRK
jgi:predicted ester cyclase